MSKRPQDTSAEEPDGGNPHIRFRGGPRQGDRPGLLNKFASTRLVARDIKNLVGFYEKVMNKKAEWLVPSFAEIVTPAATLAINTAETVALFKEGSAEPGANRTAILEFQ